MEDFVKLNRSQLIQFFKDWKQLERDGGCAPAPNDQEDAEYSADHLIRWSEKNCGQ